jgi:hypothetical protein
MTVHFPAPEQAPDQPEKEAEAAGVGVRVIEDPAGKVVLQVVPQLIPAGVLVIVPEPVGDTVKVKTVGLGGGGGDCCTLPPQATKVTAR